MSRLKIFVLTHKEVTSSLFDPSYMQLVLNTNCNNDMEDLNDKCMYETYMIYDVYRNPQKYINDDTEYIGFCHYRRYWNTSYDNILNILDNKKVILAAPIKFGDTILDQFNSCHDFTNTDFKIIKMIIGEQCPEYLKDLNYFLNQYHICLYNMCITSKKIFNEYCSWAFNIIQEYFKFYNINNYVDMYKFVIDHPYKYPPFIYKNNDPLKWNIEYQSHIGGFLLERLLNVYFLHNYKNDIEYINIIKNE